MPANECIVQLATRACAPRLSVLTPFHKHDPSRMLERLASAPSEVEFVLLDDGSCDAALLANVVHAAQKLGASARIIVWGANRGRAAARNRLLEEARGEYLLFLDADMIPDRASFLHAWLSITRCQQPDVAFGGLSLRHAESSRETALHRNLFAHSDCRRVQERELAPAQTTASANLLVRRSFLAAHPFDDGFRGWGFEDTEWALRAQKHTTILHVDNPATHAGLDSANTLLRKSAEAGANFARLAAKHPQAVTQFAAYRTARALRVLPARRSLRVACAWTAKSTMAPLGVRRVALKLFRASHYAEHLA